MATQTLSTADAILKDLYVGPVIEQLNYKTWMLDKIERDGSSVQFGGRRWVHPIHSGRNRQRGSMVDGGTLVTPGKQTWVDAIDTVTYHNIGIELTDVAIASANGDNQEAFLNLLDAEVKGAAADLRKDINRQVYGDGTGLMATVTSTANSGSIVVDSVQYLGVGDPIDILVRSTGVSTDGADGLNQTILTVTPSTKTITVAATVDHSNLDGIYLAGSYGLEMPGLRKIVSQSRTLHGINSATAGNEYWNAQQRTAAGAIATESLFEQLADDVGSTGNGEIDVFITTRGIRRRLADQYQSQKRFTDSKAVDRR